ncbi:tyrosine-type recombinase/integrase [Bryobacter aggregatus]|uniref:tyrosine-type recombinase/integrase n=1 Tax=Bryobacter aggregatus TaxID=360054 RepID=UPI001EE1F554|nr:tyrosine-type recombinase/integrase [Bryobacter aggregatus]
MISAHERACKGIRATQRGLEPIKPRDPYLLHHLAVVLADCALRPEEAYRLRWSEYRDGSLYVAHGKTANARRVIPVTERVKAVLDMRTRSETSEWVFAAPTKSGHVEQSTVKKQHAKACKAAKVVPFVLYTFRHTRLTRWAEVMDPYTLAHLAGIQTSVQRGAMCIRGKKRYGKR